MKSVFVLGNGQLSHMLRQAGEPLGIRVYPLTLDAQYDNLSIAENIITTEIESWPENSFTRALTSHSAFVNRNIFSYFTDRLTQKKLLNKLDFPTAAWRLLINDEQWSKIFSSFGEVVIVKRRTGGYDGRGQWHINTYGTKILPEECYGKCIVEECVHFSNEVSLIGARRQNGDMVFYPLTYNLHEKGILRISVSSPQVDTKYQQEAEYILKSIMHKLDYIGVIAMECFVTSNGLIINELAPRVHNSGHWTQHGASISQFELHLRAVLNLPLPKPVVFTSSVMLNLIGITINLSWLEQPLVHLHWYNKEIRSGRKVGHLNITDSNQERLIITLNKLIPLLPKDYFNNIVWAIKMLKHQHNYS